MRTVRAFVLAVLVLVTLAGCAQLGAILNPPPDPRLAANAIDMNHFTSKDTDPADAARAEEARRRAAALADEEAKRPGDYGPRTVTAVGESLMSVPGLTAIGALIAGIGGVWQASRNGRRIVAVAGAVDQHATLIDSATHADADDAAKVGVPKRA